MEVCAIAVPSAGSSVEIGHLDTPEKKMRRKKKNKLPSVFESTPAPRNADACYESEVKKTQPQSSVFESSPSPSRADALHAACTNHREHAQELILSAAEHWEQGDQSLVFESNPLQSVASVRHDDRMASDAAPRSVYESQPEQSAAHIRAISTQEQDPVYVAVSVYESTPAPSSADVRHSAAQSHVDNARACIEAAINEETYMPEDVAARATHEKNIRVTEVRKTIQAAMDVHSSTVGAHAFIFESHPQQSSASARHGEQGDASGEEETDDDED